MSTMRKKTLNLQDLFVEPNFDETKSIGMDAKGRLKRLTPEQLSSVRERGEIEVNILPKYLHTLLFTYTFIDTSIELKKSQ